MNYVQHTRTAHELLTQQPEAKTQHLALYWELFFQWNAGFFKGPVELDHQATMKAARIGNKHTYRDTLRDLDKWGLIAYQPSQSRYDVSRCQVVDLSGPEVAHMKRTGARNGPHENRASGPEVAQVLKPEMAPMQASSGPILAQDTLLVKTSFKTPLQNVGGGTKKNRREGFADDGLSSAEVLDDNAPPDDAGPPRSDGPGEAPKKTPRVERGAPKKKGVREQVVGATATAQNTEATSKLRGGQRKLPETTFQESAIYDKQTFTAAFQGTDYELADLNFYHEKVNIWRDRKTGEPPRRADWVATAKRFMLNDAEDNRLKLAPAPAPQFGAGSPHGYSGGPDTGYRTSRWD